MIETSLITAGLLVVAGRWANKKPLDFRIALGMVILIIMLTLMAEADRELAERFALLVLLAAALTNVVPLSRKFGFSK